MNLKDSNIKNSYTGKGSKILHEFLLPALEVSQRYDRITSYYTIDSLLAISQGIDALYRNQGKMRLIMGVHSIPEEIVDASMKRQYMEKEISKLREQIRNNMISIQDGLEKKRLTTIAWMIEDDLLEIKAASVIGEGIFHPKTCVMTDEDGNQVVAIGSPNETRNGLGCNFEQLVVLKSWETKEAVLDQMEFFDSLWENRKENVVVLDISEDTKELIKSAIGRTSANVELERKQSINVIQEAAKMPANFFVSGDIPALYMHQERAVIDALSRWPVRVLFADEVGLGKTFEVASTVVFLTKYCNAKRAVILTPKAVLKQWQDELYEKFHLRAWLYDSSKRMYVSPEGKLISMKEKNPLGKDSPDLILMSAQLARGSGDNNDYFRKQDTVMPDILVVDEAHSARISKDINGKKKKTRMYKMLENCSKKIPHLILATATPMQKEAEEYHAMLKLLGLPKQWISSSNYRTSLKLIGKNGTPDLSDANTAAILLHSTITCMKPATDRLEKEELKCLSDLLKNFETSDAFERGKLIIENWNIFRKIMIKLHPAHLLTVRNTRRALEEVGYKFPVRRLIEVNIEDSEKIQLFYSRVNEYIVGDCFSVEHAIYPDRKINTGFVRISYRQRVASSLYSCKESLKRRFEKMVSLKQRIEKRYNIEQLQLDEFQLCKIIDDMEEDELFCQDDENIDLHKEQGKIDINKLIRALNIECTSLNSLIEQAEDLIKECGDMKLNQSIDLAKNCLMKGDSVLLFSRYTDTISALIDAFKKDKNDQSYAYGVYTGKQSMIITKDEVRECDKDTIKRELFSRRLRIVFCSDAASEGLNLQAARVLINVDVPWTPARLEQRIGRIARLGQTATEVDIYNVWYPNSIEARMYHRIQCRLNETNLAIGEFPEVVANSIKKAVLEDSQEDSSMIMLKKIRNDYQRKALEQLWQDSQTRITTTNRMREHLMEYCKTLFDHIDESYDKKIIGFRMPDDTIEYLTAETGMPESISLKSKPWKYRDVKFDNIEILKNKLNQSVAFSLKDSTGKYIKHEEIVASLNGQHNTLEEVQLQERPTMLPEFEKLSLSFVLDKDLKESDRPSIWLE